MAEEVKTRGAAMGEERSVEVAVEGLLAVSDAARKSKLDVSLLPDPSKSLEKISKLVETSAGSLAPSQLVNLIRRLSSKEICLLLNLVARAHKIPKTRQDPVQAELKKMLPSLLGVLLERKEARQEQEQQLDKFDISALANALGILFPTFARVVEGGEDDVVTAATLLNGLSRVGWKELSEEGEFRSSLLLLHSSLLRPPPSALQPRHIAMSLHAMWKMQTPPPPAVLEQFLAAWRVNAEQEEGRKGEEDGRGGREERRTGMSSQDVGLVTFSLMSLGLSRHELMVEALASSRLLPPRAWDGQAIANTLASFSFALEHLAPSPSSPSSPDLLAVLLAGLGEVLQGEKLKGCELGSLVSSLSSCGLSVRSHPLLFLSLGEKICKLNKQGKGSDPQLLSARDASTALLSLARSSSSGAPAVMEQQQHLLLSSATQNVLIRSKEMIRGNGKEMEEATRELLDVYAFVSFLSLSDGQVAQVADEVATRIEEAASFSSSSLWRPRVAASMLQSMSRRRGEAAGRARERVLQGLQEQEEWSGEELGMVANLMREQGGAEDLTVLVASRTSQLLAREGEVELEDLAAIASYVSSREGGGRGREEERRRCLEGIAEELVARGVTRMSLSSLTQLLLGLTRSRQLPPSLKQLLFASIRKNSLRSFSSSHIINILTALSLEQQQQELEEEQEEQEVAGELLLSPSQRGMLDFIVTVMLNMRMEEEPLPSLALVASSLAKLTYAHANFEIFRRMVLTGRQARILQEREEEDASQLAAQGHRSLAVFASSLVKFPSPLNATTQQVLLRLMDAAELVDDASWSHQDAQSLAQIVRKGPVLLPPDRLQSYIERINEKLAGDLQRNFKLHSQHVRGATNIARLLPFLQQLEQASRMGELLVKNEMRGMTVRGGGGGGKRRRKDEEEEELTGASGVGRGDVLLYFHQLSASPSAPLLLNLWAPHLIEQLQTPGEDEATGGGARDLTALVRLLSVINGREEVEGTAAAAAAPPPPPPALLQLLYRRIQQEVSRSDGHHRLQDLVLLLRMSAGSELGEAVASRLSSLLCSRRVCSRQLTPPLLLSLLSTLRGQPAAAELLSASCLSFSSVPAHCWASANVVLGLLEQLKELREVGDPKRAATRVLSEAICSLPDEALSPRLAVRILFRLGRGREPLEDPEAAAVTRLLFFLTRSSLSSCSYRDLSCLARVLAMRKAEESPLWQAVAEQVVVLEEEEELPLGDAASLAVNFARMTKLEEYAGMKEALRTRLRKELRGGGGGGGGASQMRMLVNLLSSFSGELSAEEWEAAVGRMKEEDVAALPLPVQCSLLLLLSKAKIFDRDLMRTLANEMARRAEEGSLPLPLAVVVLKSIAASDMVWIDAAGTEDVFLAVSRLLQQRPLKQLSLQQLAIVANSFARVKVFDEPLFLLLSRAIRKRRVNPSLFRVQIIAVLLFAFSRVQVEDPQLLDFLSEVLLQLPPEQFTPQSLSVIISVYAGAHRRRSMSSLVQHKPSPAPLPPASGILAFLASVAIQMKPQTFEPRHIRAIVEAYHRAGVRAEGLWEVMSKAWQIRWGTGFKSEQEMIDFLTSLDEETRKPKTSNAQSSSSPGAQGDTFGALKRWIIGGGK
ncbi:hypothetical protein GUITHDRAFT_163890 [Guillardia theta CCMP2712]|uniref:Uncharacterized protein n=2 Tax=Guillardia theta TaxID=55529 RepID=L1J4Q2_GUITC|nr:hypothetical protein GUITHDRAFT_163890 [Guillardia theta CCMP2712]EKX43277.1 hypothetical protein GUITHDRAFT_163890 [Guillardia theta CCMP2712]|eukprot:XP_005830257.1 hypothetical protein GUITHDRAFT_163890 [Guillardia theta CCMP2712]